MNNGSGAASEFENILNTIQGGEGKKGQANRSNTAAKTQKSSLMPQGADIFESILEQNERLNTSMQKITSEIVKIRERNAASIEKNLTFSAIFTALDVAVQEYEYQSSIFEQYAKLYDEMCNEENIVKVLDLLRLIVTDRRTILNDVMSNLLRIQKLDNERIKMDSGVDDDDLVGDMINPDSM